jgi:TPR repeat protein
MDRALTWYYSAAANGNAMAQYNLGDMYARGTDIVGDMNAALRHWEQAAQQNHPRAPMRLALACVNGDTGMRDYEQAIYWC